MEELHMLAYLTSGKLKPATCRSYSLRSVFSFEVEVRKCRWCDRGTGWVEA